MAQLTLSVLADTFAICRLAPDAPIPAWARAGSFISITRTRGELSIVCLQSRVPREITCDKDWRCLRVEGPLDLTLTGVLASIAAPLAQAGVSIFAISTYDTDYVLVKAQELERTLRLLAQAGHKTIPSPESSH